jgi:ribonuclease VapC
MTAQSTTWPHVQLHEIAVDTSVLLTIILGEPEKEAFAQRIAMARTVLMSTASVLEARIVVYNRKSQAGLDQLNQLFSQFPIDLIAPDQEQIDLATQAFLTYGKGNRHKAQLNFGDLFSYALAKSRNIPLLYKGEDFAHTDVRSALA